MEVVSENAALLSNYEVMKLLQDIQHGTNGQKKPGKQQGHLATITYETLQYLEKLPCRSQTPDAISACLVELKPFSLTRAEKLSLINLRPTSAVEIQLLVEESEERLTEEQIDALLAIIQRHLAHDTDTSAS